MLIWISILLIFGLLAVLGYYQGAVRFVISFIGMIAGVLLALPMIVLTGVIVKWIGIQSPFWTVATPLLINFLLIYGIGLALAQFVHRKVEHYFKYKAEDLTRLRWERLNRRLGIPLGLAGGTFWILLLGLGVYVGGYPTVQLSVNDNATGSFRWLGMARRDLNSSGLDKTVAPLDPMPELFYEVSDIMGLIYQNPILTSRLGAYPPMLLTGEAPEWQDIANDKEFMDLLLSRGDAAAILNHPKTPAVMAGAMAFVVGMQPDLKDLHEFLKTGKTKYDEEKILGRWSVDVYATIAQERKKKPDMSTQEMTRLKRSAELLSGISFVATTDNKAFLKVQLSAQAQQLLAIGAPVASAVAPAPGVNPNAQNPRERLNPGPRGGGRGGRAAAAPAPTAPPPGGPPIRQEVFPAEGSWTSADGKYKLSLKDERGRQFNIEAVVDSERITIFSPLVTLVLDKET